jgi:hypothetical protein
MREFFLPSAAALRISFMVAVLLLMSRVEANPGPASFGCVNGRSIVHRVPLAQVLIADHRLDVLLVCETWILNDDPNAIKLHCSPPGCGVLHVPRSTTKHDTRCGGLCVIYRYSIAVKVHPLQQFARYNSFECQLVTVNIVTMDRNTVATIYRPPSSSLPSFYDDVSDLFIKVGEEVDADSGPFRGL